jgi:uncharacterized protein YcgI (DUF1989 family)
VTQGELVTIPARRGKAVAVALGRSVKIVNTHGQQVVDTWAYSRDDMAEFMSMEHSRASFSRYIPRLGDAFVTNRRRPIATLVEDTSPGLHDTLIAACDRYRYELLGCASYHDNCTDNLAAALKELDTASPEVPCPLNLFMNIPVTEEHGLAFRAPVSRPGDFVVLRAEMDAVFVFSACPQDIIPVNGENCTPTEAHFAVVG